ncbi:alkaline phosphatase PhoX [Nitrosococcus wardiae]|uniref:alkaline phosphatase PhoX n=1 Tax=Nitrosococcus wardiae TaxID=1814290 RepID=UPI00197CD019|nr:alkaline phosphatase PhoX [Nitrosococcus wardiae]
MSKLSRRQFVKTGLAVGAATLAFSSLAARVPNGRGYGNAAYSPGYGPLTLKKDLSTGLKLLALPEGFEYQSFGWTGQTMTDGRPTPTDHDGMAVCAKQGSTIALVRNHELSAGEGTQCLVPGGMYNMNEYGGTTNLVFDFVRGEFIDSYTSLGGTIRNCAGGPTPWGSWVSCEETFHGWDSRTDGFNHGYVFDVPGFGISNGQPIRAAGRFSHEAVAVDPMTGVMYETEDTGESGFYKYVQPGAGHPNWRGGRDKNELLRDGGELYAMVINDEFRKDMTNRSGEFAAGDSFSVSWQRVEDPEAVHGRAFDSAPAARYLLAR